MKDELRNGLRETRLHLGLSQQELATLVGVSRQTIGGVESGQTALSITLALRLAKALGCRVEDLFWLDHKITVVEATPIASMTVGEPQRVSLSSVGGRWIAHPLVGADAFRLEMIPADGEATRQPHQDTLTVTLFNDLGNLLKTVVVAGGAPALSLWARAAERWYPDLRMHLTFANSTTALEQLLRGEVHLAGMHLFCPQTQTFNVPFVRQALQDETAVLINLGVWEEGLLVAPGNPKGIHTVADLARLDVTLINREPGAGSRKLLEQALIEADISLPSVMGDHDPDESVFSHRLAFSHQAVAAAIVTGEADVGVSVASMATLFNLGFVPLRQTHYDLVTLKPYLDEVPVQQALNALSHRWVLSQLEVLGGYDTRLTGEVVATVQAPPRGG
ncbi:MAG: substrate-binding domain-containing protein [Spirulina sp.]